MNYSQLEKKRMQLTNNLAACTLTTQEPSLTIWQIFPNASSTKRISSLEEGIGTMLTYRNMNQFIDLMPCWMAPSKKQLCWTPMDVQQIPGTKTSSGSVHSYHVSAICTHQFSNSYSWDLLAQNSQDEDDYSANTLSHFVYNTYLSG